MWFIFLLLVAFALVVSLLVPLRWQRGAMRSVFALAIAAVPIGGIVYYFVHPALQPVAYTTTAVERGDLETTVNTNGSLKPVNVVDVSSQLSGQIAELFVNFNDDVHQGEPIARLDSRSFAAKVRAAKAEVEVAQIGVKRKQAAVAVAEADLENAKASRSVLEAQIESAEATATEAKQNLDRKTALFDKRTISEAQIEQARSSYLSAAASLKAKKAENSVNDSVALRAEANLQLAKGELEDAIATVVKKKALLDEAAIDLDRTTIRAPIDGVVVGRDVDLGQTVAASLAAPKLFRIAQDLHQMEVHAKVDEADIGRIQEGQSAAFTVASYPGRTFSGKVVQIRKSPEEVQNVVTYTVVISAENKELALLPGMTAYAKIVVQSHRDVLRVPNAALRFTPASEVTDKSEHGENDTGADTWGAPAVVWTLNNVAKPAPVHIRIGDSDAMSTEVTAGELTEGQRVIVGTVTPPERSSSLGLRIGF